MYSTDARIATVEELFVFAASTHAPIEYFAATTRAASDSELANAFLEHLGSAGSRRVLAEAGFDVDDH